MSDMIYYKNGEETFRISPPTVRTKTPKTKLEVKKMDELITLNLTLKELQQIDKFVEINDDTLSVLAKIKDAYPQQKMHLENEGEFSIVSRDGYVYYRLEYPTNVIWYNKSMVGRLEPIQDIKTKNELESLWLMNDVKYQKDDEPYCPDEPPEYDEVEWDEKDNPPEPTSTAFRQKLFDGIKSVFYDPDYERTYWKMKVNMAVDEVLTHFYDIIPDGDDAPYNGYDEGWNSCIKTIKQAIEMELENDD